MVTRKYVGQEKFKLFHKFANSIASFNNPSLAYVRFLLSFPQSQPYFSIFSPLNKNSIIYPVPHALIRSLTWQSYKFLIKLNSIIQNEAFKAKMKIVFGWVCKILFIWPLGNRFIVPRYVTKTAITNLFVCKK